ncbi:hypothetical protein ACLESD_35690 [Pyxidicoccus sp. 3LFB2]
MLIVSKVLLGRMYESGAWQLAENKKRDPDGYVVVKGDLLQTVARSVYRTAEKLDLLKTDVSLQRIFQVLRAWAHVSEKEDRTWVDEKTVNAPIFSKKLWEERENENRRAEVRVYDNTVDLVLAIVGFIRAQPNETLERKLAKDVLFSARISRLVVSACEKVYEKVKTDIVKRGVDGDEVIRREYKDLHKQSWAVWTNSFRRESPDLNIMVLHDIYNYYDTEEKWPGPWSDDAIGEQLKKRLFKNKSTMRHNVGTVNEDTDWAARARWHGLPVWAGPSGTTYGLCHMLRTVGKVTNDELLACAYALFGLWASPRYPKTATPIHHLFGVMTAVSEFLPKEYSRYWDAKTLYTSLQLFAMGGAKL